MAQFPKLAAEYSKLLHKVLDFETYDMVFDLCCGGLQALVGHPIIDHDEYLELRARRVVEDANSPDSKFAERVKKVMKLEGLPEDFKRYMKEEACFERDYGLPEEFVDDCLDLRAILRICMAKDEVERTRIYCERHWMYERKELALAHLQRRISEYRF